MYRTRQQAVFSKRDGRTFEWVLVEAELADDVLRYVGCDGLSHLAFGSLEQLVELVGIELQAFEEASGPRDNDQNLTHEVGDAPERLRAFLLRLKGNM